MNVECADLDVLNTTEGVFEKHKDLKEKFDLRTFMSLPIDPQGIVLEYLRHQIVLGIDDFCDTACDDNHQVLQNLTGMLIGGYLFRCIYPEKRSYYQKNINNNLRKLIYHQYHNIESHYCYAVSILIRLGADINECDQNGDSPLHLAVKSHNDCLIKLLVEQGADCCACNSYGHTTRQDLSRRGRTNMNNLLRNTEIKQKAIKVKKRLDDSCSIS